MSMRTLAEIPTPIAVFCPVLMSPPPLPFLVAGGSEAKTVVVTAVADVLGVNGLYIILGVRDAVEVEMCIMSEVGLQVMGCGLV